MWESLKLGDICDLQNGFAFKSKDYVENSNTLNIRMSNIRPNGNFDPLHNVKYLPDDYSETYASYRLFDGDLIIAMTDMAGDPKILGKPTLVEGVRERTFLLNQRVGKLHSFSEKVFVPFISYYLTSLKDYYKSLGAGGLQINISKKDILSAEIKLPPLVEQKRIVAKIDAAFAEIELQIQTAKKTITLSETNLSNFIDAKTAGDSNWTEFKVMDLGVIQTGSTPKTSQKDNYGEGFPFIKPPHFNSDGTITIVDDGLTPKGSKQSRIAAANSVLMVCIGATIGKVGVNDVDACFNQQINSLTPSEEFDVELIYWQMRGRRFQSDVLYKAGQATLPIINKSKWQNLSIFLPQSKDEQIKIRQQLRELNTETEKLIANKAKKIDNLQKLKSAILAKELQSEAA